jgi:Family of unknown function (DUF5681)
MRHSSQGAGWQVARLGVAMTKNPPRRQAGSYKVGKGRPPSATRWKPGQSGNPKGRPRDSKNLEALLTEALSEKVPVQEREEKLDQSLLVR